MDAQQKSTLLKFYKRPDVQAAIVESARDREVGVRFGELGRGDVGFFAKRPDVLGYPRDVLEFVLKGATSFHVSVERWSNPMQLGPHLRPDEVQALRSGWDLVLDVDCPFLEISQIAADLIVQALRYHGISSITAKFSGNHGFHLCVPFEAFPEMIGGKPTRDWFPDGPRRVAQYLQQSMIKQHLSKRILAKWDVGALAARMKKQPAELLTDGAFDPFKVVSIDTVLITTRHLFRAPYSFNEKSGLVSVSVDPSRILQFDKAEASPEHVQMVMPFLARDAKPGEAKRLLVQALDFKLPSEKSEQRTSRGPVELPESALVEMTFPPCIREHLAKGLTDGKKRAMFILTNFLGSVGWSPDAIEEYVRKWNEKNKEPLREQLIKGHCRHLKLGVLPPNCDNKMYYKDLGICHPDSLCARIKNPANYAIIRTRMLQQQEEENQKGAKRINSSDRVNQITKKSVKTTNTSVGERKE